MTLVFFVWALVHYFLASAGIAKSLKTAALRNAAVPARRDCREPNGRKWGATRHRG